ncbi:MAG: hypothetical protein HOM96_04770 [Rickettsiales bacterium]|jgi:hypothetical protein|nr:hypothetical protein [Rickettsiales bacterium]
MRSPTGINTSDVADQLHLGHPDQNTISEVLKEWQFPLIKTILINQESSKPYALHALCGGKIIGEFQPILLEAIRPISSLDAGRILKKANLETNLQLELGQIIVQDNNQELACTALSGANISTKVQKLLLALANNSSYILKILEQCKINEEYQLELIDKLSIEEAITIHRKAIFYPDISLLTKKTKSFLRQKVEQRQDDIFKPNNQTAEIIYLDKQSES